MPGSLPVFPAWVSRLFFARPCLLPCRVFSRPWLFTQTPQIRQMVAQVLTFMVLFNWTSALSHILTSAVQGTGDSRYPLWVTLAGNILMRLAAGYLLAYWLGWGLIGIWSGIVLDFLLRGTLLGARFIRQYKA